MKNNKPKSKQNTYHSSTYILDLYKKEGWGILDFCYRNIDGFRKPGMIFSHDFSELQEWAKCKNDPLYFIEKYCEVPLPIRAPIKLRDYQKKVIKDYFDHRFNIIAGSRQVGSSLMMVLLMLHEAMFNENKYIDFMDVKSCNAAEKMQKVQCIYANLPFFLKPGVMSFNKTQIYFENGSRISYLASPRTIGHSIHSLFINDFAFFHNNEEIFRDIYPAVSSLEDSRIMIVSAPNHYNKFYELLTDAERKVGDPKKNMFNANRIYYWEVQGRDSAWREREIINLGSEDLFNSQYDLSFRPRSV